MRVREVTRDIYDVLPEFFRRFGRPMQNYKAATSVNWKLVKYFMSRNMHRWFVVTDEVAVVAFASVWRCHRPCVGPGDKTDLHFRVTDFLVLPEYQGTKAGKMLIARLVKVGIAENGTYISIDVAPEDADYFKAAGFAPSTDTVSLVRKMPWMEYDKPKVYPATTAFHQSGCISAAEASISPDT